jgi:predicted TIM-barrel fold metal-dependent hydrolase
MSGTTLTGKREAFSCTSASHSSITCCCPSRRGVVAALGAIGATAVLSSAPAWAQTPAAATKPARIDTHHHYFPASYLGPLETWWTSNPARGPLSPLVKNWTVARAIEEMDRSDVATGVASLPIPGARLTRDIENTRTLARICNEFGAQMVRDYPGRFGLFATLPMPDVDGCLREIEYSLDTLHADGIGMMTSWDNTYPGDPALTPIFEELNRRKAVVFFHPLAGNCCGNVVAGINEAILEYPYDTGRAIVSLLLSGSLARFRDIKFIFSHAGGPIFMLAGRIENTVSHMPDYKQKMPDGVRGELQRLYYDTANSAFPQNFAAVLSYLPISQLLFGSDTPYVSIADNVKNFGALELSDADRKAIERGNAVRLLPRLNT